MTVQPIESHVEMILLKSATALDIAAEYAQVVNERYQNPVIRYSQYHKNMMRYGPSSSALRDIKGIYFAEIDYCFYNNAEEEDEE